MNYRTNIEAQDRSRWRFSLENFLQNPEEPVLITTFRGALTSSSRPVFARGIDGCEYIVKGWQSDRGIINEQIVSRLGLAMGAPVGKPEIVEISSELLELDQEFSFLAPGKAHGTHFIPNCFDDRDASKYKDHSGNRERFALLSVLFGWVHSQDEQFIYQTTHPCLVHSVDHGRFFPGGYTWTTASLQNASDPEVDRKLILSCSLKEDEIKLALSALRGVTEKMIIQAVASPPDEWGITIGERMVMVEYLIKRQKLLLESL
ncbi:MAG: hypothetical protein QNJ63_30925 [Calothrix sp. MO_192.B10]|nr:hypothetical protein [Calothrix sp. MO_192.B10]